MVKNCPVVADDARRIFDMYYDAANQTTLPSPWPKGYDTTYNAMHPMQVTLSDTPVSAFIASSPDEFCTLHRTSDLDALVGTMTAAESYVTSRSV